MRIISELELSLLNKLTVKLTFLLPELELVEQLLELPKFSKRRFPESALLELTHMARFLPSLHH